MLMPSDLVSFSFYNVTILVCLKNEHFFFIFFFQDYFLSSLMHIALGIHRDRQNEG